jgi:pentapeptide MXKDX repeat protein
MRKSLTLAITLLTTVFGAVAVAQMMEPALAEQLAVHEHEVLGSYLTDSHGRTLYIVVDDDDQPVSCTGECADAWPPFTLESIEGMMGDAMSDDAMSDDAMSDDAMSDDAMSDAPMSDDAMAGDSMAMATLDPDLVGTVARDDGTTQLTYRGHPLYYFVGDEEPGEVNCQAIENFGGTWYVVAPSGDIVKTAL